MNTHALNRPWQGLLGSMQQKLEARRRARAQRKVEVYRVYTSESVGAPLYADQGDERLLLQHVERALRAGERTVVVDRITMTVGEAEAIPAESLIG